MTEFSEVSSHQRQQQGFLLVGMILFLSGEVIEQA
jgi:hypothetical protein